MKIVMPDIPEGFQKVAVARLYEEDARSTNGRATNDERRITGWHKAWVPQSKGSDNPFGLAFAGWRCLVFSNKSVQARFAFSYDSNPKHPQVTGVTTGNAVSRWVTALGWAQDREQPAGDYEPALLLVPDAVASGLLLVPQGHEGLPLVWSLIRQAQRCQAGLKTLDEYFSDCSLASSAWTKRAHA
jgi:hypothetical protein